MVKKILALFFLGLLVLTPFVWNKQGKLEKRKDYVDINPQELYKMLKKKDFTLINTHIPYAGEIPQTDLFIPYNEIEKHSYKLPQDKNAKIVIYCRSGRMSSVASAAFVEMGYKNVMHLKGGMKAWIIAGYRLIIKKQK